jgi:CTP:phosphocholine cytidylyltransferase-like protein
LGKSSALVVDSDDVFRTEVFTEDTIKSNYYAYLEDMKAMSARERRKSPA